MADTPDRRPLPPRPTTCFVCRTNAVRGYTICDECKQNAARDYAAS